jgi:hypothetical protein
MAVKGSRKMPPEGFAERALEPVAVLAKAFSVGGRMIARWRKLYGIDLTKNKIEMPADFAAWAARPSPEIQAHYGISKNSIARFRAECGIKPVRGARQPSSAIVRQAKPEKPKGSVRSASTRILVPTFDAPRDTSLEGLCAEHLRKVGYKPVVSIAYSAMSGPRDSYQVGGKVMPPEEMIALAKRLGFKMEAWAA